MKKTMTILIALLAVVMVVTLVGCSPKVSTKIAEDAKVLIADVKAELAKVKDEVVKVGSEDAAKISDAIVATEASIKKVEEALVNDSEAVIAAATAELATAIAEFEKVKAVSALWSEGVLIEIREFIKNVEDKINAVVAALKK